MEKKNIKITKEFLEGLGWEQDSRGLLIKRPYYPFALKNDQNTKEFQVIDMYFPKDGLYSKDKKAILSNEDYDNLVKPILKVTNSLNHIEVVEYQIRCLITSYQESMRNSLNKIQNLDETIKSNQIRRFIDESFSPTDPIFRATDLSKFLELKAEDNGDLSFIKNRLKEDDKLFLEIEAKCNNTLKHLKQIFSSAQAGQSIDRGHKNRHLDV